MRATQALAEASSSLTKAYDAAGGLAALLDSCRRGLDVDAGGILVEVGGRLELLASSSHQVSELETHQLDVDEGPCVESFQTGDSVQDHAADALLDRWPRFGGTMVAAGFASVLASPLEIQGRIFGAMGLFRRADAEFTSEEELVARAFADIAAILTLQLGQIPEEQAAHRLQEALDARVLLEQAKGVLAGAHGLTMADAYELLVQSAKDRHEPLTAWAVQVIASAQTPRTSSRSTPDAPR
ncbi:MAG: GAF and ANTAR domain-containing protein [Aeromicrobium sp.]